MYMGESAAEDLNLFWLQVNMFVHLAALAVETRPSQGGDLFAEVRLAKAREDKTTGGSDTRMGDVVEREKGGCKELPVETSPNN